MSALFVLTGVILAIVIIKISTRRTKKPPIEQILFTGLNKLEDNPKDRKRITDVCYKKLSIVRNYEYN